MLLSLFTIAISAADADAEWKLASFPRSSTEIHFTAALELEPDTVAAVDSIFEVVTDPNHVSYGQYLTPAELFRLSSVSDGKATRISKALVKLGATSCDRFAGTSLKCVATVAATEKIFATKLASFVHRTGKTVITLAPGAQFNLPEEIVGEVTFVTELVFIGSGGVRATRKHLTSERGNTAVVVPETILKLYNVTDYGSPDIVQAAGEFGGNWYGPSTAMPFYSAGTPILSARSNSYHGLSFFFV